MFKKTVHILSIICYILILVYIVVSVPLIFGYKPVVVISGSMEPTFQVGSIIYYKNVSQDDIRTNDIITYKTENDTMVTHRVYAKIDGEYQTKGDANQTPDPIMVKYENIQGKTSNMSIPYIGYYVKFVNEHMYLVTIVIIILFLEFVLSNIKKRETKEELKKENSN